jgi:hypothetical protein
VSIQVRISVYSNSTGVGVKQGDVLEVTAFASRLQSLLGGGWGSVKGTVSPFASVRKLIGQDPKLLRRGAELWKESLIRGMKPILGETQMNLRYEVRDL